MLALTGLGGCSNRQQDPAEGAGASGSASNQTLPASHVHGIGRDPGSGDLYVATHHGLFVYGPSGPPQRVGPAIDLMGFTVAGPGRMYASGHPGEGSDLPQPVGLIESTDGGKSWAARSRGGQSDFHALTASRQGVLGYDGTLRRSPDGKSWQDLEGPGEVIAVAASPDGRTALATTTTGLQTSPTLGTSWAPVAGAPPVLLLDWADNQQVVGVDATGAVFRSNDAGRSWRPASAAPLGQPQAVGASVVGDLLEIFVVTREEILRSVDGGATFTPRL